MKKFLQLMAARESNPWTKYNQQGLVFQLDCQKGCTAEKWTDLKGGVEFASNGAVTLDDNGVPYFNGSAYYISNLDGIPVEGHTIEFVFQYNSTSKAIALMTSNVTDMLGGIIWLGNTLSVYGASSSKNVQYKLTKETYINKLLSLSAGVSDAYLNKTALSYGESGSVATNGRGWLIGYRTTSCYLIGKIYAIRIYDRLLTADEMIANQEIDLARFKDM